MAELREQRPEDLLGSLSADIAERIHTDVDETTRTLETAFAASDGTTIIPGRHWAELSKQMVRRVVEQAKEM